MTDTPFKKANDNYTGSNVFLGLSDPTTLGASPKQRQFLENRLLSAYRQGWNDRGNSDAEALKALQDKL